MPLPIAPPKADEFGPFHQGYIAAMAGESDGFAVLDRQRAAIERMRGLTPAQADHAYAEGKWTIKEIVGHLTDAERIFTYRLLRIARGDRTPLAGFDEQAYTPASRASQRTLEDLVNELAAVRAATLALAGSLDEQALDCRGQVSDWTLSARALVYITAGHFQHHVNVLRDRYGVDLDPRT